MTSVNQHGLLLATPSGGDAVPVTSHGGHLCSGRFVTVAVGGYRKWRRGWTAVLSRLQHWLDGAS